jgi:Putative Flp pilus-assembly TadE/G-like
MKKLNDSREFWVRQRYDERGQTTIIIVLALSLFLLAFTGLAVDYSNLWFHRQAAQGAADAACQAGAMDMYLLATGSVVGSPASFSPGFAPTALGNHVCSATDAAVPCKYASLNAYSGAGLTVGTESNEVKFSFPSTISGVTAPLTTLTSVPFMRVDVTDRVRVYLASLITGAKTQDVLATAKCGLVQAKSPIPIIILHPTMASSFSFVGNPNVAITGGPSQSIQVNSSNSGAVSYPWGNGLVDLSLGGPDGTGSTFGVFGGASNPPCTSPCKNWNDGTTGQWSSPSSPDSDPFASLLAPTNTGTCVNKYNGTVCKDLVVHYGATVDATHDPGCPVNILEVSPPRFCTRYWPGTHGAISIANENALFVPGVYYMTGNLSLGANSVARPSAATGDGSSGTMFYLSGTSGIDLGATSGGGWTNKFPLASFNTSSPVPVECGTTPVTIPATLNGNIFLGPCTGTYGDPLGQYRGMIFFHDRATAPTNLKLRGGSGLLVAGNMYFHQDTTFGDQLSLYGNTGSDTRVLGDIVLDQLQLGGGGTINMELNPAAAYSVLKVALLQ